MKAQSLAAYPLILALIADVAMAALIVLGDYPIEVLHTHSSAHAAAHGMTEDDLVGGQLQPWAKQRLASTLHGGNAMP